MIEQIKEGRFELIRDIVKANKIKALDFSHKEIDESSAPMIAKALEGLDVSCVNLSNNLLGAKGALAFVEQLQGSNVTEIDFSWNGIGEAVIEVVRAIANSSIEVVKLAYNSIPSQGLNQLQPILVSSNIKADLSHNKPWQ